ncbi:MAG TPA: ATP-binding protein [Ktedonobacteraceae bacterium]|nr:ATP-binding protein [Ktedonobacteraceae bacterium]
MERLDDILNRSALRRSSHHAQRTQPQRPQQEEHLSQPPTRRTQAESRTTTPRNPYTSQQAYSAKTQGTRRSAPPSRPEPLPSVQQPARHYGAGSQLQRSPLSPQRLADYGASTYRRYQQDEEPDTRYDEPQSYTVPSHTIYYHTDDAIPTIDSDVLANDDILTDADIEITDDVQTEDLFAEEEEEENAQSIYYDTWDDEYEIGKQYSHTGTKVVADTLPAYETHTYTADARAVDGSVEQPTFTTSKRMITRDLRNVRPSSRPAKPPAALPEPRTSFGSTKSSTSHSGARTYLGSPNRPPALPEPRTYEARTYETHINETRIQGARTYETHTNETRIQEARAYEARIQEARANEARIQEARANEARIQEARAYEAHIQEMRVQEARTYEARASETRPYEAHIQEAHASETRPYEARANEARIQEAHSGEARIQDVRQPDPMLRSRTTQPLHPQQDLNATHIREISRELPAQERVRHPNTSHHPVHIQPRLPETDAFIAPAAKPLCQKCRGAGYLRANVPYGHPNFGKPIACECKEAERKAKRRDQLREMSNLDAFQDSTFQTFNWRQPGVKEAFDSSCRYAQSPDGWLVLIGPNGCGKTHLAAAIANQCLETGSVVLFAVVPDLLDHLRAAFAPTATELYDQLFAKMREAEVLVLDDLGAQQSSPWANEKLFQLLNYRYNMGMPTVITANPKGMQGIDERIRSRMGDIALAETVHFNHAQDYRPHHGRRN